MTKGEKLELCDRQLLFSTLFILASGIQLEATGSRGVWWVWIHVIAGCMFLAGIIWHLYLHFGWKSWVKRLRKQKSPVTRWLAIFALLMLISSLLAFFHWIVSQSHSPIGAVHGKIGFIFLVLAIGHTLKRMKFFRSKKKLQRNQGA